MTGEPTTVHRAMPEGHHEDDEAHSGSPSIGDYGLLADCNGAALVNRAGSIDWLCLPRYDSPAIFARLLDPEAGHWSITPVDEFRAERRYLPGTLVIETTFTTATGQARLIDALAFAQGQRVHDLGLDCPHEVLRLLEVVAGTVEFAMELAPRPEYGLIRPLFRQTADGGETALGPNRIGVRVGTPTTIDDATMRAAFRVSVGQRVGFSLRWADVDALAPEPCPANQVSVRIADTIKAWQSWETAHDIYQGAHRDMVRLGSRVLKGLSYRPTGAIV
ncbi:MAG: trehalase-like domain-containing protein, partial [Thermomicrobiales bacterium]